MLLHHCRAVGKGRTDCFSPQLRQVEVEEAWALMKERHASCLTKRELQQRDYEQGDNATKRHKGQRSRFHMYIKAGLGGNFKGDNKPCLHYLATCQLLPQASASAPPSMLLRIRKAFCSRLAERPKNVCAALQHTQQTIIRRKYSGTLFQDALDGGGRVHNIYRHP